MLDLRESTCFFLVSCLKDGMQLKVAHVTRYGAAHEVTFISLVGV